MATRVLSRQNLRKLATFTLQNISQSQLISPFPPGLRSGAVSPSKCFSPLYLFGHSWAVRWATYGSVNLVVSDDGKPKFQIEEVEPSKKGRYLTKKRLKLQRKRVKKKRKEANKNDPRRIRPKGKKIKQKFPTAEARLKYKIEKAKLKEAMLVEKLKKYEVAKAQGPMAKPDDLSGEERFYLKKVSQKKSNYVPVGRRGVFGGVILNMHLHWKKHETVKVICKPCKPGQIQEYANEIARLSGGIPVNIIGDDTIVFYRGKNYVQPEVMSPVDTLSKKKQTPMVLFLKIYYSKPVLPYTCLLVSRSNVVNCSFTLAGFPSSVTQFACELGRKVFVVAVDGLMHAYVCYKHATVVYAVYI